MDKELINSTVKELTDIATALYQGNTGVGMERIGAVIPDIEVIVSAITDEELQSRLIQDALAPMLAAMENGDGTELADRITYELIPILEELA